MTQTVEAFWLRPQAKALGRSVRATATRGLGRSASWQRRSIIPWSSGYSSGSVTRAPIEASAMRSLKKSWASRMTAAMTSTSTALVPRAIRTAMNTAYTSPSRNMVSAIRALSERSRPYHRRATEVLSRKGSSSR